MDSFDLHEPIDVLTKLPKDFYTELKSKKWLERKSALEFFLQILTENPRLATNVSYHTIVSTLKIIIDKDANINVTSLATKCLTCLANGLRTKFANFARDVAPVIFEKFKEKKPLLKDNLIECIDAVYATTNLESLADDIINASSKSNPNIKIQLNLFLYRVFKRLSPADVPKKFLKDFIPTLIKHASDSDPEVREAASSALGAIMKCVGAQTANVLFGPFVNDKLKMTKVEEFCAKAIEEAERELKENQAAQAKFGQSAENYCDTAATVATVSITEQEIDSWEMFEPVDILSKLPVTFKTELVSKKWLERKSALELLLQLLIDNPRLCTKANYSEIVQSLCNILSKDSNINVASIATKCLLGFSKGLRINFNPYSRSVLAIIFIKFKEKKSVLRDPLVECADAVFATTNMEAISEVILEVLTNPNPDIKINLDLFLYRNLKRINAIDVSKKFLKDFTSILVKHTSDSDPEVRNASYSALGAIMKCIGKKNAMILFGDLASDKLRMTKIEEFYESVLAEVGPEPVSAPIHNVINQTTAVKKLVKEKPRQNKEIKEITIQNSIKSNVKNEFVEKKSIKPLKSKPLLQKEKPKKLETIKNKSTIKEESKFLKSINVQRSTLQSTFQQLNLNNTLIKNTINNKSTINSNGDKIAKSQYSFVTPSGNSKIPRLCVVPSTSKSGLA